MTRASRTEIASVTAGKEKLRQNTGYMVELLLQAITDTYNEQKWGHFTKMIEIGLSFVLPHLQSIEHHEINAAQERFLEQMAKLAAKGTRQEKTVKILPANQLPEAKISALEEELIQSP